MRLIRLADSDFAAASLDGCSSAFAAEVAAAPAARQAAVDVMTIRGAGLVPSHEGRRDQLCAVIAGSGWVTGAEGEEVAVSTGDVVAWTAGEWRGWHTEAGLTLFSLRADGLLPPASDSQDRR